MAPWIVSQIFAAGTDVDMDAGYLLGGGLSLQGGFKVCQGFSGPAQMVQGQAQKKEHVKTPRKLFVEAAQSFQGILGHGITAGQLGHDER